MQTKSVAKRSDIGALKKAIDALANEVQLLRKRLTGDEEMQTVGLIHEVAEAAKMAKEAAASTAGLGGRVKTLEDATGAMAITVEEVARIRFFAKYFWQFFMAVIGSGVLTSLLTHFLLQH